MQFMLPPGVDARSPKTHLSPSLPIAPRWAVCAWIARSSGLWAATPGSVIATPSEAGVAMEAGHSPSTCGAWVVKGTLLLCRARRPVWLHTTRNSVPSKRCLKGGPKGLSARRQTKHSHDSDGRRMPEDEQSFMEESNSVGKLQNTTTMAGPRTLTLQRGHRGPTYGCGSTSTRPSSVAEWLAQPPPSRPPAAGTWCSWRRRHQGRRSQ